MIRNKKLISIVACMLAFLAGITTVLALEPFTMKAGIGYYVTPIDERDHSPILGDKIDPFVPLDPATSGYFTEYYTPDASFLGYPYSSTFSNNFKYYNNQNGGYFALDNKTNGWWNDSATYPRPVLDTFDTQNVESSYQGVIIHVPCCKEAVEPYFYFEQLSVGTATYPALVSGIAFEIARLMSIAFPDLPADVPEGLVTMDDLTEAFEETWCPPGIYGNGVAFMFHGGKNMSFSDLYSQLKERYEQGSWQYSGWANVILTYGLQLDKDEDAELLLELSAMHFNQKIEVGVSAPSQYYYSYNPIVVNGEFFENNGEGNWNLTTVPHISKNTGYEYVSFSPTEFYPTYAYGDFATSYRGLFNLTFTGASYQDYPGVFCVPLDYVAGNWYNSLSWGSVNIDSSTLINEGFQYTNENGEACELRGFQLSNGDLVVFDSQYYSEVPVEENGYLCVSGELINGKGVYYGQYLSGYGNGGSYLWRDHYGNICNGYDATADTTGYVDIFSFSDTSKIWVYEADYENQNANDDVTAYLSINFNDYKILNQITSSGLNEELGGYTDADEPIFKDGMFDSYVYNMNAGYIEVGVPKSLLLPFDLNDPNGGGDDIKLEMQSVFQQTTVSTQVDATNVAFFQSTMCPSKAFEQNASSNISYLVSLHELDACGFAVAYPEGNIKDQWGNAWNPNGQSDPANFTLMIDGVDTGLKPIVVYYDLQPGVPYYHFPLEGNRTIYFTMDTQWHIYTFFCEVNDRLNTDSPQEFWNYISCIFRWYGVGWDYTSLGTIS